MEFTRRPGLTNSSSETAIYGFVHPITPENIVVNRDNYVVLHIRSCDRWNALSFGSRLAGLVGCC
jgi:hypothetical protein